MDEQVSITRAKLAEMEISEDMETSKERGKDSKEEMDDFEENTAAAAL